MNVTHNDMATLNALLEPLLNLTAHCSPNKVEFCKVEGALEFLISTFTHFAVTNSQNTTSPQRPPTRNQLAILENSSGILRNISSYIISQENLVELIRTHNVIAILIEQLMSTSLAIVSNACITLSHFSSRSVLERHKMIELGAIKIMHNLTKSKHQPIQVGASKTLKNLIAATSYFTPFTGDSLIFIQ